MNRIIIYKDKELLHPIDEEILFENRPYFVDISDFKENERDYFIKEYGLSKHVDYHKKNDILTLKLTNVVGQINLFGNPIDVRSNKLNGEISGQQLFESLLEDITRISANLPFHYSGTSYSHREVDWDNHNPTDVERFDYFYQFAFKMKQGRNLYSQVEQIINNHNFVNKEKVEITEVSKSKQFNSVTIRNLGRGGLYTPIDVNSNVSKTKLANKIKSISGRDLFPTHISNSINYVSIDTLENRFVKFILFDIQTLCSRLLRNSDTSFNSKIIRLREEVQRMLNMPFFKQVKRLDIVPSSSTVLLKKSGYRELYYHYIQSNFGIHSVLDSLHEECFTAGLKDIATLYEIWVYFKMAEMLFPEEEIKVSYQGRALQNGDFIYTMSWSGNEVKLNYNTSFNRSNNGSYSVSLRPDISLETQDKRLFLFDAKYKFNSSTKNKDDANDLVKVVKSEDIHKMHAYLDAIPQSIFSIAIYPGSKFVFYEKESSSVRHKLDEIESFNGVGALPLIPFKTDTLQLNTLLSLLEL